MTVFAVLTAALFPLIHIGRLWKFYFLLPYPHQRYLWVNFKSPLLCDVFAVNKSDREGADRLVLEIEAMLQLRSRDDGWCPPVIKTVATRGEGIGSLLGHVDRHREYLEESERLQGRRRSLAGGGFARATGIGRPLLRFRGGLRRGRRGGEELGPQEEDEEGDAHGQHLVANDGVAVAVAEGVELLEHHCGRLHGWTSLRRGSGERDPR